MLKQFFENKAKDKHIAELEKELMYYKQMYLITKDKHNIANRMLKTLVVALDLEEVEVTYNDIYVAEHVEIDITCTENLRTNKQILKIKRDYGGTK